MKFDKLKPGDIFYGAPSPFGEFVITTIKRVYWEEVNIEQQVFIPQKKGSYSVIHRNISEFSWNSTASGWQDLVSPESKDIDSIYHSYIRASFKDK